MAGYDIGVSMSNATSSGANLSGATDTSRGANFGTLGYGPGSVVHSAPSTMASSPATWIGLAVVAGVVFLLVLPQLKRR